MCGVLTSTVPLNKQTNIHTIRRVLQKLKKDKHKRPINADVEGSTFTARNS